MLSSLVVLGNYQTSLLYTDEAIWRKEGGLQFLCTDITGSIHTVGKLDHMLMLFPGPHFLRRGRDHFGQHLHIETSRKNGRPATTVPSATRLKMPLITLLTHAQIS